MFRVRYSDGDEEDVDKQDLRALRLAAIRSSTVPSELRWAVDKSTVTAKKKKKKKKKKKRKAPAKATRSKANATSVSSHRQATGNTLTNSTAPDIDTSKVELWSCDNAEKNTYNCVGTVCNPCKVKMVAEEEKKGKKSSRGKVEHGTKRNNDKLKRKAADDVRKGGGCLPTKCCECGGRFV